MSIVTERIRRLSRVPETTPIQGHWFSVAYMPNLISGELINIGVAFVDATSKVASVKILDDLDKIGVMFGERVESEIRFARQSIEITVSHSRLVPPSENIKFSEPRFASGASVGEILDDLFQSTVRLLSFTKETTATRFFAGNEKARQTVFNSIRLQAGISAEKILAVSAEYIVEENGCMHSLDIPLRGERHLGNVVSAAYSSRAPLENNLMRASLDLEIASRIFQKDSLGLFVLRPSSDDPHFGGKKLIEIDNIIDMMTWKLHKKGLTIAIEDDVQRLASQVLAWGHVA